MFASTALIAALVKSKAFPTNNTHDSKPVQLSREAIESVAAELKTAVIAEDAASTAGSQTTIVDEETTIILQSRIKNALEYLFASASANDKVRLVDANHAVDYVAYGLSDLVFVYPGNASGYLGQGLKDWQSTIRNAHGDLVKVVEMETRTGALQAVQGAIENNTKSATVLTSSQALLSMIPNIHALALGRKPVVFHVGAYSVDEDLAVYSQVDAVLAARNSGAIVLSSSNVQEAHDMSIVAHILAQAAGLPVIHYFDGASADIQKTTLFSYNKLSTLVSKVAAAGSNDAYSIAEGVLAQFGYKPFEYTGAADAQTVLVALGAATASVANAVQRAADKNSVGLVTVRLYRPWSEAGFIAAVPHTARHIVVLEQTDGLFAFNGPLFLDVAAAVRFGLPARQTRPRLVTAQASTFGHLGAAHIPVLIKEAENKTYVDLTAQTFLEVEDNAAEDISSVIFWDVEVDGSAAAAKHVSHLLHNQDTSKPISIQSSRDAYRVGGAVANTRVVLNEAPVATKAGYIGVHNIALTKEYNILASAAKKATLVVNGPWKHGDEIESQLTNEFKLALTQLDIKLYAIDINAIAEQLGLHQKASHVIWEVVYLTLTQPEGAAARIASLYYELDNLEDEEGKKRELAPLVEDIVAAVSEHLTQIELLPPWTILEINDQVLPSVPVARGPSAASAEEDASDSDAQTAVDDGEQEAGDLKKWHQAAWQVMFKEAYETETAVRPDLSDKTYLVKLQVNKRLTPTTYDRNLFHLEFDTTGTDLKYDIGDALGVHGHNDYEETEAFLEWYGVKGEDVILVKNAETGKKEVRTVFQLFSQTLDVFGRPSKKFYEALASYSSDPKEKEQLLFLVSSEGKEEYKKRVDDTVTYEDLLREFTSAKPPVEALVNMITPIKPRHYSIASSQKMHANQVHLLIVAVDWVNAAGKKRFGQCTRYLSNLQPGSDVTVSIKHSVMKLPPLDEQPVIMAGLGTGMAPFRAFIQERALAKAAGRKVGPMVLYFGSRHRSMEYLYGEELEAYHADGLLTRMGLAFSRDQKQKIYIQHKMKEDAEMLHDYLVTRNGHFYLCGPTWPVPDVKDAVVYGLKNYGNIDEKKAGALIEEWKEKEKYILEVY